MKEKLPTKTSEKIRFILSVLVFLAFVPLTIWGIPKVMALSDPVARENLQQYFASKGIGGWLIFLVVQILQVVVAMIPGEPIEICAGLLYGPVWGTLSCMLGILIGSLIVLCSGKNWVCRLYLFLLIGQAAKLVVCVG